MATLLKTVIFDWNRTIFDPETGTLDPAALDALAALRALHFRLILLTRREPGREALIDSSGARSAFDDVLVVDRKSADGVRAYLLQRGIGAPSCTMVGDRVREEIAIGNALGMRTVWLQRGKFSTETPRTANEVPSTTITELRDLLLIM